MSEDPGLVVVRAFSQVVEAQLAISALQAAGLDARLEDENIVAANWMYSNAVGGVKVLVPHGELSAARAILDLPAVVQERPDPSPPGTAESSDAGACPRCGSRSVVPVPSGRRAAALTWLVVGIPLMPVRRRMRCNACGQVFK
jgi:hypothetical protein